MSDQPNAPAPEASSPAPEAPKPTEPTAVAPEAPKPTEQPKPNVWDNPESAKAEIEKLRRENAASRTNAKQAAADEARNELAQQIGKALGLVKDEPVDPAALTEQLTASQADAKRARVELAVFRNAEAAGADPLALLDSASFLAKAAALDPSDAAGLTAAMQEAVTANPRLGAAPVSRPPAPNPAQGASGSGSGDPSQLDEAWVKKAAAEGRHAEIVQAQADGRLKNYLASH